MSTPKRISFFFLWIHVQKGQCAPHAWCGVLRRTRSFNLPELLRSVHRLSKPPSGRPTGGASPLSVFSVQTCLEGWTPELTTYKLQQHSLPDWLPQSRADAHVRLFSRPRTHPSDTARGVPLRVRPRTGPKDKGPLWTGVPLVWNKFSLVLRDTFDLILEIFHGISHVN